MRFIFCVYQRRNFSNLQKIPHIPVQTFVRFLYRVLAPLNNFIFNEANIIEKFYENIHKIFQLYKQSIKSYQDLYGKFYVNL